ncbi:hypothetical protein O7632_01560 [Solwaraspora sp. WMMD406]|uniref:hypothetical protein n=1 Tax=Solwaraspora sp. WMMD406 TaxID=3016095 RepID=UPI002417280E|nr:hypothetical protein [Solwaraspora sp. WMMD406]MDG4762809.1 hypothetical protein [Solwaraspora sp. WMMD406]
MDVFSRTFLPAAAETSVPISTTSRHMPVFRRCVSPNERTVLVARCQRPEQHMQGDYLLLLTKRRLVVTHETLLLRRLRLHLNSELRHLDHVTWTADPRSAIVELAVTAIDGVRERFMIKLGDREHAAHVEALLSYAFLAQPVDARTTTATTAITAA